MAPFIGFFLLLLTSSSSSSLAWGLSACSEEDNTCFRWIPGGDHPCTITRMTKDEFLHRFGPQGLPLLYPEPLVIVDGDRNIHFRNLTHLDHILHSFPPDFPVTLSSSNSFSEHRRTIAIRLYIEEVLSGETLPDRLSNETWYLFGETYTDDWKQLLKNYELPPCRACTAESVALSFGIGNRGSGVQWHIHGPGFSEAVHGRKHWVLYRNKPRFHPNQTSRNWMENNYLTLSDAELPFECTLNPGDLIYFPDRWWHATINLDRYTAFVSTFTQEHELFSML